MTMTPRRIAPVAKPLPPKPPQLNLVASAQMPDVDVDAFGPGDEPPLTASALAAAGWTNAYDEISQRRTWHRPAGEKLYREVAEEYNNLVAAVGVMSDYELKQAEDTHGVTVESLPKSVFPATMHSSKTRWTEGFSYAPENQNQATIADHCGSTTDLPLLSTRSGLAAPAGPGATGATTGGTLKAATYDYIIVPVDATGNQGTPTSAVTGTVASGSTGSVAVSWTASTGAASYNVYGRTTSTYQLIANVTGTSFTDTGAASPTLAGQTENLPLVTYIPFLIREQDTMSAFGFEARDYVGRALRLLDNATPNALERELWSGGFATNTTTGPIYQSDVPYGMNAFLTQSGTPTDGGTSLVPLDLTPGSGVPSVTRGIQILEDYLANTGFGGQGMLHVAPETSPNLLGARRVGALLLSVMDNIIVPGSGYPTSGATGPIGNGNATPATGTAWIFCSDLVSVRLDDPVVYPATMAEALDRGDFGSPNTVRVRAQRFGAATFDGARLAACRVTLST